MKKKFSGKRPVMFYQEGSEPNGFLVKGPRMRIFYPNGEAEFFPLNTFSFKYGNYLGRKETPCWFHNTIFIPSTIEEAMRLARKYDKEQGFPKMEFVGEL